MNDRQYDKTNQGNHSQSFPWMVPVQDIGIHSVVVVRNPVENTEEHIGHQIQGWVHHMQKSHWQGGGQVLHQNDHGVEKMHLQVFQRKRISILNLWQEEYVEHRSHHNSTTRHRTEESAGQLEVPRHWRCGGCSHPSVPLLPRVIAKQLL